MENRIFEHTYRILREIGRGGMSTVYLAEHLRLGTQWAVKQVRKNQIRRFDVALEANILKRLSHPMLPRIIDIFEDPEYIYIVEDYVAGISMEQYLARFGKVDEALAVEWFKAVCEALIYLHSRPNPIIYRDMKPSNIIVRPDGTLKLVDFGNRAASIKAQARRTPPLSARAAMPPRSSSAYRRPTPARTSTPWASRCTIS